MATSAAQTADPTTDEPPRRRRWIPLSLRVFAAILVILGVVRAVGIGVRIYRQYAAIGEIERLQGIVTTKKGGPTWLRGWLGDNKMRMLDDVTDVNLAMSDITDEGLRAVAVFSDLLSLNLARTKVTDAGIEHVKGIGKLQRLTLSDTRITDSGVAKLKGLTHLTHLSLERTKISDTGLAHLKRLTALVHLDLSGTNVTDAGIRDARASLPNVWIETKSRMLPRSGVGGGLF